MTQRTESLPIACVEGWSAGAEWTGVRVRDLLDLVDAPTGRDVDVYSLQPSGSLPAHRPPGRTSPTTTARSWRSLCTASRSTATTASRPG